MSERFRNKTVLVTGSSRGIGKAIALGFAEEKANVILCCKTNIGLLSEVEKQARSFGGNTLALKIDVTNFESVNHTIGGALDLFDNIDILVNNAGDFENASIYGMNEAVWNNILDVNLSGVFNCIKAVLNKARVSRIINITSVQALTGVAGAANYAAAKAGVIGLTKSVARELAEREVTVNAIAVGFIEVGMLRRLPQKLQDTILGLIPVGRFGKPEEVASLVMFLASEEASYITGQVVGINGGYYM